MIKLMVVLEKKW